MESLVISRSWQRPRSQLKSPSLCGAVGLGFPVCHQHFFLPPYEEAEVRRGQNYLLSHCLVTKQALRRPDEAAFDAASDSMKPWIV